MFLLIFTLFAAHLWADNVVHLPQNADSTRVESKTAESKITTFDGEIKTLEKSATAAQNYTQKYYKRVNYENPFSSESHDYQDSIEVQESPKAPAPRKIYKRILRAHKPKLVIIIDDIATTRQLEDLARIGLKLTPSIFPHALNSQNMRAAAKNLDFFMVHLPLEAISYKDEIETLKTRDGREKMQAKIAQIKRTLPQTAYINNHTGSKFTQNRASMEALLSVLDAHNIIFVDSRTTPNSALNDIAREQNRLILYRDIFIDNRLDAASLRYQIIEGVKIAKDRGYAILIAHPHKETLNALHAAKNSLLQEVDVIYLNELDSMLKRANITQYANALKSP